MNIRNIFSWMPEKDLSLEQIENIVKDIENGLTHEGYSVEHQLPSDADKNVVDAMNELIQEGDSVCFLLNEGTMVSLIGYQKSWTDKYEYICMKSFS